jgi:hypothetical protein
LAIAIGPVLVAESCGDTLEQARLHALMTFFAAIATHALALESGKAAPH